MFFIPHHPFTHQLILSSTHSIIRASWSEAKVLSAVEGACPERSRRSRRTPIPNSKLTCPLPRCLAPPLPQIFFYPKCSLSPTPCSPLPLHAIRCTLTAIRPARSNAQAEAVAEVPIYRETRSAIKCARVCKKFEYFRIFSNVSHHFSNIFERFATVFERFRSFLTRTCAFDAKTSQRNP